MGYKTSVSYVIATAPRQQPKSLVCLAQEPVNMLSTSLFAIALGATAVLANPFPGVPELLPRQGQNQCRNQSCLIATVAGSTGATVYPYSQYPTGDTMDGDCCIIRYFPAVKSQVYAARPNLQPYCQVFGGDAPKDSNPPGVTSVKVQPTAVKRQTAATTPCKPNVLIFVKGTFEPGDLGVTLGPNFQSGLDSNKWEVIGVNYDNSYSNDNCLGLPGGVTTRQTLNQVVTTCPNSAIALVGYSQGAMVVRNACFHPDTIYDFFC